MLTLSYIQGFKIMKHSKHFTIFFVQHARDLDIEVQTILTVMTLKKKAAVSECYLLRKNYFYVSQDLDVAC